MEPAQLDLLPIELQPYRHQFASTARAYVEIMPTPGKTALTHSKILGLPYLPANCAYPKDADGRPMILLAQLNFAEIPPLPDYPERGILQFFLAADDQLYGADLQSFAAMQRQTKFQVRYFENVLNSANIVQDFEFLRSPLAAETLILPAQLECQLNFKRREELIAITDRHFEQMFGADFFSRFKDRADEIRDTYWQSFSAQGHKIGGYAFFFQQDPRLQAPKAEDWILLLQIDSDSTAGIMWGDVGVGSFFIPRFNLINRDFSQILYTWDCG